LGIERIELKFLWEAVALQLAAKAGINTPKNQLLPVAGKAVLLSHRFDRAGDMRVPFLSAMTIMGMKDGERGTIRNWLMLSHSSEPRSQASARTLSSHGFQRPDLQRRRPSSRPWLPVGRLAFAALPFWVDRETVQECTMSDSNSYSCSAAAVVRAQIKIAGRIMSMLTFWKTEKI
jgi:hypothetical protein